MVGAIIGAVSGLASAAYSFYQADKQDKAAKDAAQRSQELFKQARSKAEIDYFAGLTLPMDAYNQAYEQNLAGQKLAVEGLQEADTRFLAGGVGRIGAQSTAANEAVRNTQGQQLYNLDMLKKQSRDAINNRLIGMDLDQATGEAQRERDQQELRANAIQNAFSGVNQAATSIASEVDLYFDKGEKKPKQQEGEKKPTVSKDAFAFSNPGGQLSTPTNEVIDVTGGSQGIEVANPPSGFNFSPIQNNTPGPAFGPMGSFGLTTNDYLSPYMQNVTPYTFGQ